MVLLHTPVQPSDFSQPLVGYINWLRLKTPETELCETVFSSKIPHIITFFRIGEGGVKMLSPNTAQQRCGKLFKRTKIGVLCQLFEQASASGWHHKREPQYFEGSQRRSCWVPDRMSRRPFIGSPGLIVLTKPYKKYHDQIGQMTARIRRKHRKLFLLFPSSCMLAENANNNDWKADAWFGLLKNVRYDRNQSSA